MSHRRIASLRATATFALSCCLGLLACDAADAPLDVNTAELSPLEWADEPGLDITELSAEDVPWPEVDLDAGEGTLASGLATHQTQHYGLWTIETFVFTSEPDFLAISTAPDVLFAPFPQGIAPLDPAIDDGFMLGFQFRDLDDNVIGFGSELEVLDFETLTGDTTYTLMLNGRGSIAFSQREDFAWLFDLVEEMIADEVSVRSFEPAVAVLSTIPGTARVMGGSGEFAHAFGFAREIGIVHEINLETRVHRVSSVLQIAYL